MSNELATEGDVRDDFLTATKELMAKKSGYICSYPGCKRMTIAGSEDRKSGLTIIGIAAHITAASKKGPRYDPNMSSEERAGESNGIWACQIHGKFIDDNPSRCTVEELHRWKSQHEKWVFDRVESGAELFNLGIYRLSFRHVGIFSDEYRVPIGRHNVLVGLNTSGKSSICQILSAFSGGSHWKQFNRRFGFNKNATKRSFIEVCHQANQIKTSVRLSPQFISIGKKKLDNTRQRVHIEVNGCPSVDWPRRLFRVLYFEEQLRQTHSRDPKNTFIKAIRYLADVFGTHEDLVWDSLREELFATSLFGNRFKRTGHRKVDILLPDGREFYLPHEGLSGAELQIVFLEVAIKLVHCAPADEHWMFVFDTPFFERMDTLRKALLFRKLTEYRDIHLQTLFCLNSLKDAELLKDIQSEKWINALHFGNLTLHSFL